MTIDNGLILVNAQPFASKDYIGNMMSILASYSQVPEAKYDEFDRVILPRIKSSGKPLQLVSYDVMAMLLVQANRNATVEELVQHVNDTIAGMGDGSSVHLRAFDMNFIVLEGMLMGGGVPIDEINDATVESIAQQMRITAYRVEGFLMAFIPLVSIDDMCPDVLHTVAAVGCQTFGLAQILKSPYLPTAGPLTDVVVAALVLGSTLSQQIRDGIVASATGAPEGKTKDLSVN